MKKLLILVLIFGLIGGLGPASVLGQAEMVGEKLKITDINFATDSALRITQDSRPPEFISGPTLVELEPRKAVFEWRTDKKASGTVLYGLSAGNYEFENGSATFKTTHRITLSGLDAETTYHYQVVSSDPLGASTKTANLTFTTPADTGITSIRVSDIGYDRALITFGTGNLTKARVEYGTDTGYGLVKATTAGTGTATQTVQLTDLLPGTAYHFRIVAENDKGAIQRTSDQTFTTIALPRFESVNAILISPNEVELRWVTNTPTSGIIRYNALSGPQTDKRTAGSPRLSRNHSVIINGLIGDIDYVFEITATDEQGKQVESGRQNFRTPVDTTPPKIHNLKVQITRSGDSLVLRASWSTDEPAKGEIVYGPKTRLDETVDLPGPDKLITEHTLVATGLKPSTPYGLTAFNTDPAGNRAAAEISFVSPRFQRNIFQLIADTFFSKFGWLVNLWQNRSGGITGGGLN